MNLMNLLLSSLTSTQSLDSVAKKTGLSSSKTKLLLMIAIPILLKAMKNNASDKEGALSLLGALAQHKDTRSVEEQLGAADLEDGAKIIGHILGSDYSGVINQLTSETGLTSDEVGQTLNSIAPVLLSGLSDATTAASTQQAEAQKPAGGLSAVAGLFGSLLGGAKKEEEDEIGGALLQSLLSNL
ncbi:MAG: DUF937 domain-containing protein [Eubacterium sp.]|nr:DUF937 domain-containing protein [Eubacterium sp.]